MELVVFVLLLALVGVLAGLVGSLTGVGGAVIVAPVLVLAFGAPFPIAAGAGLVTVLSTSTTTGSVYVRRHLTDLRIGMFLEIATVPGALAGAGLTVFLVHHDLSAALLVGLGGVLLVTFASSVVRWQSAEGPTPVPDARSAALGLSGTYHDEQLGRDVAYQASRTSPALGVSFGAGVVSGMFGIGGGVFKVVALEHFLRLPIKVATATSNFMIGVTAAAGAGVLLAAGYVDPYVAAPAALGTALGAAAGSRLLPGLKNRTIRFVFLLVIAGLAVETILRGLGVL